MVNAISGADCAKRLSPHPKTQFYQTSNKGQTIKTVFKTKLLAAGLEALVDGFSFFWSHRYFLILLAEFFLHERDGVIARGQALDFIVSALVGNRVERSLHHVDVHLHPRMLVTFHRQHNLFAG